jgi:hypothetical protein
MSARITPVFQRINRGDGEEAFNIQADNFAADMEVAAPEFNALGDEVELNAATAEAAALTAQATANVTLWVSGHAYTAGTSAVVSPITWYTYRCISNTSGTIDPSADATHWKALITPDVIQAQLDAKVEKVASTNKALPRFSGTTGNIQNSGIIVDDNNNVLTGGKSTTTANGGDVQVSRGMSFPATQVACLDPNTLDDYEEGYWTPSIEGESISGTATYALRVGRYTKIGRSVHVTATISYSAFTGTGAYMRIADLPYVTANSPGIEWMSIPELSNITLPPSTYPMVISSSNQTKVVLYSCGIGTGTPSSLSIDTSGSIYFSLIYESAT